MSLRALKNELLNGSSYISITLPPMGKGFESPLADRFVRDLSRVKGAPEHEQIVRILVDAKGYRFDDAATGHLNDLLRLDTPTIEQNLDTIRIPEGAIWIEYPDAPRRLEGASTIEGAARPVNVGALVCVDEHDHNRLAIVTAWDFEDGSTRHSYAVASLHLDKLSQHAWLARNRFSRDPAESFERIMDLVHVTIPPGLADEMKVVEELDDPDNWMERLDHRARGAGIDVSSEVPFILAALISLGTDQVRTVPLGEGRPDLVHAEPRRVRRLPFMRPDKGFRRHGTKSAPKIEWVAA